MITKNIYLLDPYTDIIKINAVGDCEFKLRLNGGIVYTQQEIIDRVTAFEKLSDDEDLTSKLARYVSTNMLNFTARSVRKIPLMLFLKTFHTYLRSCIP